MMKLIFIIGIALILSACNLPINRSATPDLVSTQVSQILTMTPLISPTIETQNTPEPNATPSLTPTVELAVQATFTPIPLFSSTPSFTSTFTPTESVVPTGEPTWKETFINGTSFGISGEGYDDTNTKILVQDESLTLISVNGSGWRGWRMASHKPLNYYLSAEFQTETCSGSDQYGIVTQSPDYENGYGYYFGLTCDGRYSIQKWNENGLTNLDGWSDSSKILIGNTQINKISVLKSGENYKFFVNDSLVSQVTDNYFLNPGFFGPFIAGISTTNFTVRLREIAYWTLP